MMALQQLSPQENGTLFFNLSTIEDQPSKPKRRKTKIACDLCRVRKSKCDGVRPVCGPCSKRSRVGETCTYTTGNPRPENKLSPSNERSEGKRRRLGEIFDKNGTDAQRRDERSSLKSESAGRTPGSGYNAIGRLYSMANPPSHNAYNNYNPALPQTVPLSSPTATATSHRNAYSTSYIENNAPSGMSVEPSTIRRSISPGESESSREKDAMGDVDNWGLKMGFLGTSSAANFMRQIRTEADGRETPGNDHGVRAAASSHVSTRTLRRPQKRTSSFHSTEFVLPPRKTADRLMKIHWDYSQIIFPWLDRLLITKRYEALWTGEEDPEPYINEQVFYCILNTIFAISFKLDQSVEPEEQERLSQAHFVRAQNLLSFNILDIGHFELIQALLLMGQYLQSTNKPRKCFQSIGLAIWIAQDMGLHLPETSASIESNHEREIARRVWYGCILMDRITSMTFGRPTRISQETAARAPFPAAVDDEYLELGTFIQPGDRPSFLGFFLGYCKLHNILGDILSTFYTFPAPINHDFNFENAKFSNRPAAQDVNKLIQFDKALTVWHESLEPHLQIFSSYQDSTPTKAFRRQGVLLYARLLHIRTLLFRPCFSQASRSSSSDPRLHGGGGGDGPQLTDAITSHCLVMCTQAAQQIIKLIAGQLGSEGKQVSLPPWWHVISYVYNAATVLIAAHLFPVVMEKFPVEDLTAAIQQAFDILMHYETSRKSAQRCKSALEVLYNKVMASRAKLLQKALNGDDAGGGGEDMVDGDAGATGTLAAVANEGLNPFAELFDETEMLWLNNAPFDSDYNLWL